MLKINQNNPFVAKWNESNSLLNTHNTKGRFLGKSIRQAKHIALYLPNRLIAACINPRKESKYSPAPTLIESHGSFTKEIITPDHVHLTAHIHVVEGASSDTPTVILFNPLGAEDSIHSGLTTSLMARKCNVITFNYRGLGTTKKANDLVLDGESIYQYATQELGIERNKIHFYGLSLGGALAAQVKALHPESEGKYVGDRVFKSVFSLITEKCSIHKLGSTVKKITSFIAGIFLAHPIRLLGWEWEGTKALAKMKGNKLVVYHPKDFIVPVSASLANACTTKELVRLDPKERGPFTHFTPIDYHRTAEGSSALNIVADFLSQ